MTAIAPNSYVCTPWLFWAWEGWLERGRESDNPNFFFTVKVKVKSKAIPVTGHGGL
jgi:hypothetical protein